MLHLRLPRFGRRRTSQTPLLDSAPPGVVQHDEKAASGLARGGAQAGQAFGAPDLGELVEGLEGGRVRRKIQPGQFAAREDVDVGLDGVRIIERAGANEQEIAGRPVIAAPYVDAAFAAKKHVVRFSAAAGESEGFGRGRVRFNEFPFYPDVDDERAAGNALTIAAMAGVND